MTKADIIAIEKCMTYRRFRFPCRNDSCEYGKEGYCPLKNGSMANLIKRYVLIPKEKLLTEVDMKMIQEAYDDSFLCFDLLQKLKSLTAKTLSAEADMHDTEGVNEEADHV